MPDSRQTLKEMPNEELDHYIPFCCGKLVLNY